MHEIVIATFDFPNYQDDVKLDNYIALFLNRYKNTYKNRVWNSFMNVLHENNIRCNYYLNNYVNYDLIIKDNVFAIFRKYNEMLKENINQIETIKFWLLSNSMRYPRVIDYITCIARILSNAHVKVISKTINEIAMLTIG